MTRSGLILIGRVANTGVRKGNMAAGPQKMMGDAPVWLNGRFEVLRELGEGSFGEVFEVHDRERNERVALKVLRRLSPDALLRFKQEFRLVQDITSPHLVHLGELFESEGEWLYTMELVDGLELSQYVREAGQLRAARLRSAIAQLVDGLCALHRAGKVHRDVKPSNVRVTHEGRLLLLDFGLIKEISEEEGSADAQMVGTAAYMAPEQSGVKGFGPVGPAADFYAVGVLIYEALTGRLPYEGTGIQMLMQKHAAKLPPVPSSLGIDVPPDLEELCMALLQTEPKNRPKAERIRAILHLEHDATRSRLTASAPREQTFIGRAQELEELALALARAKAGEPQLVVVEGESGLGKSALVRRFLSGKEVCAQNLLTLSGRCYERENVAFKGFDGVIDALARHLQSVPDVTVEELVPSSAGLLRRVFPVLGRVRTWRDLPVDKSLPQDVATIRSRVLAEVGRLFEALAKDHPLIIFVDDIQWADDDCLAIVRELLRAGLRAQLLIVLAARPSAEQPVNVRATLDELYPLSSTRRLALSGLSRADAEELAARLAGADAFALAREVAGEAEGHPLFIAELVRFVSRTRTRQSVRTELDAALDARVRDLDPALRQLAEIVATAGVPIARNAIARALSLDFTSVSRQVDELRQMGLLRTSGERGVECYHDRIRMALVRAMDPAQKRLTHNQIAQALQAVGVFEAAVLAEHLLLAGDIQKAVDALISAAQTAEASFAFGRAAELYRQALEHGSSLSPERRRELFAKEANALVGAGHGARAAEAFLAAIDESSPVAALALRARAAKHFLQTGRVDRGLEQARLVLRELDLTLPSSPGHALRRVIWQQLRLDIRGLKFRARHDSEISERERVHLEVLGSFCGVLTWHDVLTGADLQLRHLRACLDAGDVQQIASALLLRSMQTAADERPPLKKTVRLIERGRELARTHETPYLNALIAWSEGTVHSLHNDLAKAEGPLNRAEVLLRESCAHANWELSNVQTLLLLSKMYLGKYQELALASHGWQRTIEERGDLHGGTMVVVMGASYYRHLLLDRPDDAEAEIDRYMGYWSRLSFQVQHFAEMMARGVVGSYRSLEGASVAPVGWSAFDASLLRFVPYLCLTATQLRARHALAAWALAKPEEKKRCAALARTLISRTRSTRWPGMEAYVADLEGQYCLLEGQKELAAKKFQVALEAYEARGMFMFSHPVAASLGALIGGDEGRALTEEAFAWAKAQTKIRPERLLWMYQPAGEACLA